MKTAVVPEPLMAPVILRSAWLINRACRPTWLSPISPSISARGTSAATESMTMMSSAPERMSMSAISRACSTAVGLGDEQRVGVDAQLAGVVGVERVLGVDERGHTAGLLRVGDRVAGPHRGLAGGLRTVDLDHAAAGQPADAEGDVERRGPGGDDVDGGAAALAQTHDRALAVGPVDLGDGVVEGLVAVGVVADGDLATVDVAGGGIALGARALGVLGFSALGK